MLSFPYFKDKRVFWFGAAPIFLLTALKLLWQLRKPLSTKALELVNKYGIRHSFKATLGMQAAIQDELVILIKTWVRSRKIARKKILLFVEDADRCTEERIIESIDALRVMLEDDEIAKRLIVITAVDERILKNAIRIKYEKLYPRADEKQRTGQSTPPDPHLAPPPIKELVSEYLDKLFISAVKLGNLTIQQKREYVDKILMRTKYSTNGEMKSSSTEPKGDDTRVSTSPLAADQNVVDAAALVTPPRVTTLEEATDSATQGTPFVSVASLEDLTEIEENSFKAVVDNWTQATPRTLNLFYYRYLLCKNLLLQKYEGTNSELWRDENVIKGLMYALLEFVNHYDPLKISEKKVEIMQKQDLKLVPISTNQVQIDREDYLAMLEIFEIIIAY